MSHTHSHNRMPFSNPLRKSLSPKLFPVAAWGQRTGGDRCGESALGSQLQIKTVLIAHEGVVLYFMRMLTASIVKLSRSIMIKDCLLMKTIIHSLSLINK